MESQEGTSSRAAESKSHLYGVFINHRGPDVKNSLVAHLYDALRRAGLRPFEDAKDIQLGRHVFKSIDEALKGSCVFVAIFSKRYAESRHCLNELCDMLESGKHILPVFYHVNPKDLSRIENGPFEEGFRKHIKQETENQISKWKEALGKIADIRGLRLDEVNGDEAELVKRILGRVREWMPSVLPDPVNRGDQRVRRLNVLVLGPSELVEEVVSHVCGADRHTQFQGHIESCGLTESRKSRPPISLYSGTDGINDLTATKAFVKATNEWWHRTKVEARWSNEVYRRSAPREQPVRTLRIHIIWVLCRNTSELRTVKWSEITEKLYGLPIQVLVIGTESTPKNVLDSQYEEVRVHGGNLFPNVQNLEELIVKVALTDGDMKGNFWRKCWAAKTRAEIEYVAKLIREIRKELGSAGKELDLGVGGARILKEVSLSRSGEFVLNFLCTYWDVPQDKIRDLLQSKSFELASGNTMKIGRCEFVKFCLIVAAIILYDTWKNLEFIYNRDDASDASSEFLRAEVEECCGPYFPGSLGLSYYDRMRNGKIREFLQDIFDRKPGTSLRDVTPCPVVSGHSMSSKITKLIFRGRTGIMA